MLNAEARTSRLIQRLVGFLLALGASACGGGIGVTQFLAFDAPVVALTHVRIIDGSGGPAQRRSGRRSSRANASPPSARRGR